MDELLQQVAAQRGMPASLVERSAKAKADKTGTTLEAVLRDWAGEDATPDTEEGSPGAGATPDSDDATTPDQSDDPAAVSTDHLVELAAEAKRMPPRLILSSAQARSDHSGASLEDVLADWAGVDIKELAARTPEAAPADSPAIASAAASPEPVAPEPAKAPVTAAAATALTMDQLLEKVAEVKGMPASLAKRSAEARSKKTGEPVEAVLTEWAGIDPESVSTTPAPAETPVPAAAKAPVAAAAATALTMDQLLEKVAEVKGMPASLAQRSAEARSKKTGEPVEAVLAEWAGIDPATVSTAAAPATAEPVATASPEPAPPLAGDEEVVGDNIEIIEAEGPDSSDVQGEDAEPPRTRGGYPIWLVAAFLLIPLLAVAYIMVSPNGPDCGSGGQLGVDPATGEAVNCDGSEYGVVSVDHFAAGGALYQQCVACHSDNGSGGVGPAFTSGAILVTFPAGSCSDHVAWVSAGTSGWPESTYGATDKPVGGVGLMPAFDTSLTEEQIAQVALYERVAFGGQDLADAEADCGLATDDDGAES